MDEKRKENQKRKGRERERKEERVCVRKERNRSEKGERESERENILTNGVYVHVSSDGCLACESTQDLNPIGECR